MSFYPPPPPPQRTGPGPLRTLAYVFGAVALTLLVGLAFLVGSWGGSSRTLSVLGAGGQSSAQNQGSLKSLDAQSVANKVDPGLVDVNTTLGYQDAQAAGTGMVLTANGEVLTNNHVVEGATSISVTDIGNGKTYKASVVGYDRTEDVAVLQLENASGLTTVTTADSSKVATGDAVVGLGNAGGTGGTPSTAAGTVTALGQSITASDESSGSSEQLQGLIQVNANIQSGDSGGALANSNGQVIGMNTAASTGYQFGQRGGSRGSQRGGLGEGQGQQGQGQGQSQGQGQGQSQQQTSGATGYAIPINQALTIAKQIEAQSGSDTVHIGKSAFLGVSVADAQQGVVIQQLVSGGAAEQAGLAQGDLLISVDGTAVDSGTTLTTIMDTHHPGDKVTLTWEDQTGQQQSAAVTLAEGPVG